MTAPPASPLQRALRDEIARRGLSLRQVSALAGLSDAHVRHIVTGRVAHPRVDTVAAVARALGVDPAAFGAPVEGVRAALLARIDRYLAATQLSDRQFSIKATRFDAFMRRLRGGQGVTLTLIERAESFMAAHPAPGAAGGSAACTTRSGDAA